MCRICLKQRDRKRYIVLELAQNEPWTSKHVQCLAIFEP